MKKFFILLVFTALIGSMLSSCKSQKPLCPAYTQADVEQVEREQG